jgi:hypothetical protein
MKQPGLASVMVVPLNSPCGSLANRPPQVGRTVPSRIFSPFDHAGLVPHSDELERETVWAKD